MTNINVYLKYSTPLYSDNTDDDFLKTIFFNFEIKGISRACLQELARHRMASLSVESSRYTLKKHLRNENEFRYELDFERASKYVVLTHDVETNLQILANLDNLLRLVKMDKSNDVIKYAMPEAIRTNLFWTINAFYLKNFLELRTSGAALKEIRVLSYKIIDSIPNEYKHIFEKILKN